MYNPKQQSQNILFATSASASITESDRLLAGILKSQMVKPSIRLKILSIATIFCEDWAGQNRFKKRIAGFVVKQINRFLNKMQPPAEKIHMAEALGQLVGQAIQNLNEKQGASSKPIDTETTARIIREFVENVDLGELDELTAALEKPASAHMLAIADEMIEHLSKLTAVIPSVSVLINVLLRSANGFMAKNDDMPPDFTVNFFTGFGRLVDSEALGIFLHRLNDSIRMIHIGNLLEGDGKTPAFEALVAEKTREILPHIDPVMLGKSKVGKAELGEAYRTGILKGLQSAPEAVKQLIEVQPRIQNARFRLARQKTELLESLPEAELTAAVQNGLTQLETHEISTTLNAWMRIMLSFYETHPDVVRQSLLDVFTSLDTDDLAEVMQKLADDAVATLRPVATTALPPVINGLADLLTPAPGEDAGELSAAVARLSGILTNAGGTK